MKLTGMFKYLSDDLETQVDLMNEEDIKYLSIEKIGGVEFWEYDKEDYKKNVLPILKQGAEIICLDTNIGFSSLDSNSDDETENFERAVELANYIKVKKVSIYGYLSGHDKEGARMPEVIQKINTLVNIAKDNNIQIIIRNHHLTYLNRADFLMNAINEINSPNLKAGLSPAEFVRNNEIVLPAYRLLKENIGVVYLNDVDYYDMDVLVGLGRAKIFDLLRVLSKDNYKEFLIIDSDLSCYLDRKRLYRKKKIPFLNIAVVLSKRYKSCKGIDKKIGKTAKEEVTPKYLAQLQIRYVKKLLSRLT